MFALRTTWKRNLSASSTGSAIRSWPHPGLPCVCAAEFAAKLVVAMGVFVGMDVSLENSAVCAVDSHGKILKEAKVASEPGVLDCWIKGVSWDSAAVGLEAGPLFQWLHKALAEAGLPVVLIETRQARSALKAAPVKTDRRDAAGLARLLQMGWFHPIHCKSLSAREIRVLLEARRSVQKAAIDMEISICGMPRDFGLRLGRVGKVGLGTSSILGGPVRLPSVMTCQAAVAEGGADPVMQSTLASVAVGLIVIVLFLQRWMDSTSRRRNFRGGGHGEQEPRRHVRERQRCR